VGVAVGVTMKLGEVKELRLVVSTLEKVDISQPILLSQYMKISVEGMTTMLPTFDSRSTAKSNPLHV
jgi:hypothetical protein